MPTAWEQTSEKLTTLRSELIALSRVTDSVARRIEAIRIQLSAIEIAVDVQKEHSGARALSG